MFQNTSTTPWYYQTVELTLAWSLGYPKRGFIQGPQKAKIVLLYHKNRNASCTKKVWQLTSGLKKVSKKQCIFWYYFYCKSGHK